MEDKPPKKNPCPDCSFCQVCSETRCSLCKQPHACKKKEKKAKKEHQPLFRKF